MTNALQASNGREAAMDKIERALVDGDLSKMSNEERLQYMQRLCNSLGLNMLTRPFQYITLQGKLTLYATKAATDQIARTMGISIQIMSRDTDSAAGIHTVIARAIDKDGRSYDSEGIVSIKGKAGDDLCNALMKAATKARRRAVLGMGGLGVMDETELETVRSAQPVQVNHDTGEILDAPQAQAQRGQVDVAAVKNQMLDLLQVGKDRNYSKIDLEDECMRLSEKPIRSLAYEERDNFIEYVKSLPVKADASAPAAGAADEPF
jgi:hypothetical protein